ncbi:VWA domain-containing protein [Nostocoides sp. F2B08]|uniref:vWA domain-containing protein n=1 Tax=Nostocoides sp. F2B08 TaxID=2653936 RepID=UPI00126305F8|nr:vWA domain-containing protein [Tetrasphaera sp. F2B08]KAB7745595.1 VWA domain-containing protein [Tetrasphaera sp. F2B08]
MNSSRAARLGVATLALLVAVAPPAIAATDSATLSNGAELSVTLDPAGSGGTFLIPVGDTDVDVPFTGSASVGEGQPNVHWTYVIDVSGSAGNACGGGLGTILDCEKAAVTNLNTTIVSDGSALDVGLAVFGTNGASADMSSAGGDQPINAPSSPDVNTVIGSVVIGGVNLFMPRAVGSGSTNYTAGLTAASTSVNASAAVSKNVVFLSDGASNTGGGGFNAAVTSLVNADATIFSFAVGAGAACNTGSDGTLQAMADATGGTCTNVANPANLPDIVQNVTATELSSVTLTGATLDSIAPVPPVDGPVTANFSATAADLTPGTHEVCAEATGLGPKSDATSEQTVEACEDVHVFAFSLAPATATNELGVDNEHTVTATVDGPAGMLAGWPVDFAVTGNNAGATGTCSPADCTTDANGEVTFTYEVPVAPSSLGTDMIGATVTIDDETGSLEVEKIWDDTTPPVAMCVPGPNPGGQIPAAPGSGGRAQNPDGFYTISAVDDVWGAVDVDLFVTDDGSGHVFGAFDNPSNIKYTQAPGAEPAQKAGSGAVDWNLKGKGDAVLTAEDGSGNVSDPVDCLVPPAPQ